jgi:hypothetical protein
MITRLIYCLLLAGPIFLLSCGKDKGSNNPPASSFTWTYEGVTYTAKTDTAFSTTPIYTPTAPVIIATQGNRFYAPSAELYIYLASLSPGTYGFTGTGSGTNRLYYTDPLGFALYDVSGSLNITSNAGNRLAGNFSVTLANSKLLSGTFSNVPIQP